MVAPPIPHDEAARQARLDRFQVVDTPAEPPFDNIARLAAHVCGVPIALVSLIDRRRQWFKARVGFEAAETNRDHSFCAHAIGGDEPLVIADARSDPRFFDNPLVTRDPHIRFYAGVPLRIGPGSALGTLCVIDRVPRQLSQAQMDALRLLADQVSRELELRAQLSAKSPQADSPPAGDLDGDTIRRTHVGSGSFDAVASPARSGPRATDLPPVRTGVRLEERYQIEAPLGQGSMGFVFAAQDLQHKRPVAIKFLRSSAHREEEAIERFAREARAVMGLGSEHVARVYDVGNTEDGVPYIVMERLQGEELGRAIARLGRLPGRETARLLLQICEVLAEAHDAGIVHRDLKPANLFLVGDGTRPPRLKLLDFGVAKLAPARAGQGGFDATGAFTLLGSPSYMSPEQVLSEPSIDGRADIWSLGVVMFEMLTRRLPFEGDSLNAVCHGVLSAPTPQLHAFAPELPSSFQHVIERCLRKRREERYASAWELARDLAALANS
ncbi:MAG TPA: protein kinase [Polyangia bacterium]